MLRASTQMMLCPADTNEKIHRDCDGFFGGATRTARSAYRYVRFRTMCPKTKAIRFAYRFHFWRRHPESDRGIKVLQTSALPLGYGAVFGTGILYHVGAGLSMLFAKIFFYFCEGGEGGFIAVAQRQKEKPEAIASGFLFGADYGARTRHLHLGKVALYQMS